MNRKAKSGPVLWQYFILGHDQSHIHGRELVVFRWTQRRTCEAETCISTPGEDTAHASRSQRFREESKDRVKNNRARQIQSRLWRSIDKRQQ